MYKLAIIYNMNSTYIYCAVRDFLRKWLGLC